MLVILRQYVGDGVLDVPRSMQYVFASALCEKEAVCRRDVQEAVPYEQDSIPLLI